MKKWEDVKKDLQNEIKAGVKMVKEGAAVVKKKAGQLTDEGKRQYKIYDLRSRVNEWTAELGAKVYELSSKVGNPMTDTTVRLIITRIRKLEAQITKLEAKPKSASGKTPVRKTAAKTRKGGATGRKTERQS